MGNYIYLCPKCKRLLKKDKLESKLLIKNITNTYSKIIKIYTKYSNKKYYNAIVKIQKVIGKKNYINEITL